MNDINQIISTRSRLFWDKSSLDSERDKYAIAERILEWGTEKEAQTAISYYGKEFVKHVVMRSRNLSPKTVNYFSLMLGIPREATRCFSDVSLQIWRPY